ncbi:MAG TPA: hypothetical protein VIT41_14290 [Microlunatus sp.]
MGPLLGAALVIGVAGLDPTAALLAVAALVAGATSRALTAFAVTVMVGAPLFGTVLSLTVAARLAALDWRVLVPQGRIAAVVGLAVGVALLSVGILRLVRPPTQPSAAEKPHRVGTLALVGAGAAYVGSLLIDPTFIAITVLAGRSQVPLEVVMMQSIWVLVSQLPLLVLLVAVHRFGQQRAVETFQAWWSRAQPSLRLVVTVALLGVGLLLVVDALWWFTSGHFLLPAP